MLPPAVELPVHRSARRRTKFHNRVSPGVDPFSVFFIGIGKKPVQTLSAIVFHCISPFVQQMSGISDSAVADLISVGILRDLLSRRYQFVRSSVPTQFLVNLVTDHVFAYLISKGRDKDVTRIMDVLPRFKIFHHFKT
jgi:hypothetical protein